MTARALVARNGYVSRMTERVAELLDQFNELSPTEREEFEAAIRARAEREALENDVVDEELAEELGRRLRVARASGTTGEPAGPFLAELKASLRAKSA